MKLFDYLKISCIAALLYSAEVAQADAPLDGYKIKTIVIDAGHGGHDTGCHGSEAYEKHVTLSVATKLGNMIRSAYPDIKVIYTREADYFVELKERANIANRNNADLFISVHCNANPKKSPYGTETYLMGLHKAEENLEVAKRENNVVELEENYQSSYDGFDPASPESQIIFSLYQNAFIEQSAVLAQSIEDEYSGAGRSSRGIKQAGFLVLWRTAMPAVLTETGFLTNSEEEMMMKTEDGQYNIAACIFRGFANYKQKMESQAPAELKVIQKQQVVDVENRSEPTEATTPYVFRVQFYSDKTKDENRFPGMADLYLEDGGNSMYRYLSGRFTNYFDAETYLSKLKYEGHRTAFVVVYKNSIRITYAQYKSETTSN